MMESSASALWETTCGYLMQELQIIWEEVGAEQNEREKVLQELEQECLQVYRNKVDSANTSRARLHQRLAQSEAELTQLLLVLGERSNPAQLKKEAGNLKDQLKSLALPLKEMQVKREERVKQFRLVQEQIHRISSEIAGETVYNMSSRAASVNENDLSIKKLEEYQNELQRLQKDKSERHQRVEKYIKTIRISSDILGMDSSVNITKVHPSLNELSGLPKNISDATLEKLDDTVESLNSEKQARLKKLQALGKELNDLWDLMDTPQEDRERFLRLSGLYSIAMEDIHAPRRLSSEIIQQAETEVKRLDQLKTSKMKELFFRKRAELEKICRRSHMEVPSTHEMETLISKIETGESSHADILVIADKQILTAQEEATSRKPIMEKVEKWILAREEELWLEEYNRDENRYSISRCAHKNLRRAERARIMVNKIPALIDSLISKTRHWEDEKSKVFLFNEVPLLTMLEEYKTLRKEKEDEKQRQREQKKIQGKFKTYQEGSFGTRPGTGSRHIPSRISCLNDKLFPGGVQPVKGMTRTGKGIADQLREDTYSVFSSFSGPFSP